MGEAFLRFGLLGPVEVRSGDDVVAVGRGHERVLLAVLLLNADRVISVSQVVDALWTAAPAAAKGQLHNLISRLRGRFRTLDDGLIESHAGGYMLRLGDHGFDVTEFRVLVERGRAELDGGRPVDAHATLTEALARWRGQPLADVPEEYLGESRQALREERLTAVETRLRAALALGRHDEVLADVAIVAADNPYRERLHEIRMTALLATGRRVDALAAYRTVHERFARDLGVEPGSALRRLEQEALRGDTEQAPVVRDRPMPWELPPVATTVVGRAGLVADVAAALRAGRPGGMVVLTGPGGAGKSTIALLAARAVADVFPDGQIYAELRGTHDFPIDSHEIAGRVLRAVGTTSAALPDDRDERIAALRSQLAGRRLLVVLDDAATEAQVRPLVANAAGCATLVTSRRQLAALVGAVRWAVPMLSPSAARQLLAEVSGADRVTREPEAAARIADHCGHLPLAVCVAAARLGVRPEWTLGEFERRLAAQRGRLDALAVGDLDVRASIGLSYQALTPPARVLFRRLGLLDGLDWPAWAASALSDVDDLADVDRVLDELVDAHLVEPLGRDLVGQARFRTHVLVAEFARERTEAEDDDAVRAEVVTRLLTRWLGLASVADEHLGHSMLAATGLSGPEVPGAPAAVRTAPADWFEIERANLVAAVDQACRLAGADLAGTLALRLSGFLTLRSYDDDLDRVLAASVAGVRAGGSPGVLLRLLAGQFVAGAQRGRYGELPAIAEEEVALARRFGDVPGEVLGWSHAARAARMLSRFTSATDLLERALALIRAHKVEPRLVVRVLAALSTLHVDLGRPERALPLTEEVVRLDRDAGEQRLLGIHLLQHGVAQVAAGLLVDGATTLAEALAVAEALADERGCAWVEHALADVDVRAGRLEDAEHRLARSLAAHERLGDEEGVAEVWRSWGDLAVAEADLPLAEASFARSLTIWTRLGARLEQARTAARLARVLTARGAGEAAGRHRVECGRILAELEVGEESLRLPPLPGDP